MSSNNGRLKVGLALGGGVARGLAHIGVLSVLESAGVPIDCIAGTSIGAMIGASYCAGLTTADLRKIAARTSWLHLSTPWVSASGLITFKKMERWVEDTIGDFDVRDLAIPFAAVASDVLSGQRVVLSEGRLSTAIRASCSVPGFAPPVEINGRMLVDGGITDNIPADVARLLGADYVIGVDIFVPVLRRRLGPFSQGIAAIETLVRHAGKGSHECDTLIVPQMAGRSYFHFSEYERYITLGEEATLTHLPTILNDLERGKTPPEQGELSLAGAWPELVSVNNQN
jgi:NTE family protein